jgi:flagellar basal-body rod protein FlgF
MDNMLYIAMTGAKQMLAAQGANSNNLANINTSGFRADLAAFKSLPVSGPGFASRVYAQADGNGVDLSAGTVTTTGRELDVAIDGDGWIAVQGADGKEAYTRSGELRISANGVLETYGGYAVLADGGPITVPPADKLEIGADGTVSIRPVGQAPSTLAVVGRIKLANPAADQLAKGTDGLMRLKDGSSAPAEASVKLVSGALESSNVSSVDAMANMIELSRMYDMQIKIMKEAQQNDAASAQLMTLA